MSLDLAYWNGLGSKLGWKSNFRADAFTSDCETRDRGYVDYLIIHHGASTSEAGMVAIMQPGDNREVSATRILGTDGVFRRVVPEALRPWTSASWLDDVADTVETVNVTGGPNWEIADLSKIALAIWAVEKFRAGRLKALNRSYIIGHYEVLAISGDGYATACPGPDMQLDLIAELAQAIDKGLLGPGKAVAVDMDIVKRQSTGTIEFRDAEGTENISAYGTGLTNPQLEVAAKGLGLRVIGDSEFDLSRQVAARRNAQVARDRQAELKEILAPLVAEAVAEAFKTVVIPPAEPIDYEKLAVAVADEDHRRSAS